MACPGVAHDVFDGAPRQVGFAAHLGRRLARYLDGDFDTLAAGLEARILDDRVDDFLHVDQFVFRQVRVGLPLFPSFTRRRQ